MLSKNQIEEIANNYIRELVYKDKSNAYDIIEKLLENNVNIIDIFNIISEAQSQIGDLWEKNKITVSEEHYATQIASDIIINVSHRLKLIKFDKFEFKGSALFFVPEGELHYLGLKMFSILLSKLDWNVDFLGQSLPLQDLIDSISKKNKKYDLVCISVTLSSNLTSLIKTLLKIRDHPLLSNSVIIVGSRLFNSKKNIELLGESIFLVDYLVTDIFDGLRITLTLQKISAKVKEEMERIIQYEYTKYEQLKETGRLKDEFLSMVSHELRTPLIPIKGYTEMLLNKNILGELSENQSKALQNIYRNVKKQESLIEDIFDIIKLELGKLNISKSKVRVSDIFDNIINDLRPIAEKKQVSILTEINTKEPSTIYCDQKRIEQVLSNLIKNSIDFVPEKTGKIKVSVDEKNEKDQFNSDFIFTIQDNGPGIPQDKVGNLFKKFYQIDTSATRKHSGTGLGLVICKGMVEAHGGKIWMDTNKIGDFSIKFSLPTITILTSTTTKNDDN